MLHLWCDFLSKHIWKCRSDKDKLRSPVFSSAPPYLDAALLENWRAATELLSPKLRPQRFPAPTALRRGGGEQAILKRQAERHRHLRHVSCSSITIGCATEPGCNCASLRAPTCRCCRALMQEKEPRCHWDFFFFVPSKNVFFFLNCQTQCTGVFLCGRVSLDDFGKCEGATVVTLHYARQLGAILWSRLISSSNRFIQIQLP